MKFVRDVLVTIQLLYRLFTQSLYVLYLTYRSGISENVSCLCGKTAIITGGNSGIGLMTSKLLASRGCKIIIACRRNAEKEVNEIIEETGNPNITFKHLDLCQFASVRKFAEEIKKETKIDILINNAGIGYSERIVTDDGLHSVMQANFFGHFLLTHLLIDLLRKSNDARVVFLSSAIAGLHDLTVKNLQPKGHFTEEDLIRIYADSKACGVFMSEKMAEKLSEFGIKVNSADPGIVYTHIFDSVLKYKKILYMYKVIMPLVGTNLYKAAQTPFHVAASKDIKSGVNYFRCKPMPKLKRQTDKNLLDEIWRESEKIVQLRPGEKL